MTVIDLTTRRLERLEKAQKDTNQHLARVDDRLGHVEDSLGRIAMVLEVHTRHFERIEDAILGLATRVDRMADRLDRLTTAIARGRTQDLARFDRIERRLLPLESRAKRKPKGR